MGKELAAPGPLSGVTVLDLSRVLAGPWATQMLADMGAEVIKVERPETGDDTRQWGPPFYEDANGNYVDAAYFMAANRNKHSITINLKSAKGQELIRQLVAQSDILVENFKVGGLQGLGLDYDRLAAINPKLVFCSITGFGQTGPMKDLPGYDYMIQAMGGMMSVTGRADKEDGAGPIRTGVAAADLFTGFYASSAILAALYHAQKTNQGQHIDLALLDCQMAALATQVANWMASGKTPLRTGNDHPNLAPYGVYKASDAPLILAIGNDTQFRNLCELAGVSELSSDSRFATNADRLENRAALDKCLGRVLAERPLQCWLEGLSAINVPAGPIQTIPQAFGMAQSQHREMTSEQVRADLARAVKTPAPPFKFSKTPVCSKNAPPALGADTNEILGKYLKLSEVEIARLRKDQVL